MGATIRYTRTDVFETFPFPLIELLQRVGADYHSLRCHIMRERNEGLTINYNRFHDPAAQSPDIVQLRAFHVEMDRAVALAYGWPLLVDGQVVQPPADSTFNPPPSSFPPLDLGHSFHETKQGIRYTLSEPARREVLDRLLALNHQRHAEELAAGLHEKKSKKAKQPTAKGAGTLAQGELIPPLQQELF